MKGRGRLVVAAWVCIGLLAGCGGSNSTGASADPPAAAASSWSFAVVGDTHVTADSQAIPTEIVTAIGADAPQLVLVAGDLVEGGTGATRSELESQLQSWRQVMAPLTEAGIPVYGVRGNHEADANGSLAGWDQVFSGAAAFPGNGPAGETGATYTFSHANALFIGLDEYVDPHRVNQSWLDQQLAANTRPHVFVFGHEPAFKAFHTTNLGLYPDARNTFWSSLAAAGARTYLCGHDHFFDLTRIDDGDGNTGNDLYQAIVGTGGGAPMDNYAYNGDNGPYTPVNLAHAEQYGYLLVTISGSGSDDRSVTLTFKQRTLDAATGSYSYDATASYSYTAPDRFATTATVTYPVVDTGQTTFYGNSSELAAAPAPAGDPFFGQDAQYLGRQSAYRDNGDGTVSDLNTGLMWVQARGAKVSWAEAAAGAAGCSVGGYHDWRLPTVKELYSLIDFNGKSGFSDATSVPYLDTTVFGFAFGDADSSLPNTVVGNRVIDGQDWTATRYVSTTMQGDETVFGVNFIDGRIKGYPVFDRASGAANTKYVRYVRGNPDYGVNQFVANGDGTVSDPATGLMWAQADSGVGMNWQDALAWVQQQNANRYLGYNDWRLPNAKELQSLVDYSRSPDTTASAAIDPLFQSTAIVNEGGAADFPWYWSGTTHLDNNGAVYIAFGRALGWMRFGADPYYTLADVHGAGAQRSDPKSGSRSDYYLGNDAGGNPVYGRGPQGDVVRIANFVRLVRDLP